MGTLDPKLFEHLRRAHEALTRLDYASSKIEIEAACAILEIKIEAPYDPYADTILRAGLNSVGKIS